MKFIPLYFFIALFIGFLIIYAFMYDNHVIIKNKKCADGTNNCYNLQ